MVFNGHTEQYINSIDEELFGDIQVMYADGMLGNKAIFDALAPITAAVFNYLRAENAPAYRTDAIFSWINDYLKNPDFGPTETEQVNNSLLTYVTQAKGYKKERFKNVG